MKVDVTLAPSDDTAKIYEMGRRRARKERQGNRRWLWYIGAAFGIAIALYEVVGQFRRGELNLVTALVFFVISVFVLALLYGLCWLVYWLLFFFVRLVVGSEKVTYEIRLEGLAYTAATRSGLVPWGRIDEITVRHKRAFVGLIVIPQRAFADEHEFDEFVENARSLKASTAQKEVQSSNRGK